MIKAQTRIFDRKWNVQNYLGLNVAIGQKTTANFDEWEENKFPSGSSWLSIEKLKKDEKINKCLNFAREMNF